MPEKVDAEYPRKFEFTDQVLSHGGVTLQRIRALRDFSDVKAGDLGGWLQPSSRRMFGMEGLSHRDDAWIYDEAKVHRGAWVMFDAQVRDRADVSGNIVVTGRAVVRDDAVVDGMNSYVREMIGWNAVVSGHMTLVADGAGRDQVRHAEPKYEFTGESIEDDGVEMRRIRALRDIESADGEIVALAGELGGWLEGHVNLSHLGGAWVSQNAKVGLGARVYGDARVQGEAGVYEGARITGKAVVLGHAVVHGNARVMDRAVVADFAEVSGRAVIQDDAEVYDHANVSGNAEIGERATIAGRAKVTGGTIYGDATISGDAMIHDRVVIEGRAQILGRAVVLGDARLAGDSHVAGSRIIHVGSQVEQTLPEDDGELDDAALWSSSEPGG